VTAECLNCVRLARANEALQRDLENVEVELRVKRAQLTRLRNESEEADESSDLHKQAKVVFLYWKLRCRPNAKTFKGDRQKAVMARLREGYTVFDLMRAIDGAVVGAYVDVKGVRHDDLELICRDAKYVESRFWKLADAYDDAIDLCLRLKIEGSDAEAAAVYDRFIRPARALSAAAA
jgi:hypothetical protein